MSSNTPNLDLVKLSGTDNFSNANGLAGNWDKIDGFAGKVLPKSGQELTDLDNVTTQGVYSYDKLTSAMTHAPNTGTYFSGTLIVDFYNANKVTQVFIQSAGRVFTRHKWNGTWGDWVELATYTSGDWTPKLYDLDTYKRDLSPGKYYRIGNFVIAFQSQQNPDLSGISTMMQIRNIPMQVSLGGSLYIGALNGAGGLQTFQATDAKVYPRPNITSSMLSDASQPGYFNILIFGYSL